jgi:hypothetical protein
MPRTCTYPVFIHPWEDCGKPAVNHIEFEDGSCGYYCAEHYDYMAECLRTWAREEYTDMHTCQKNGIIAHV